MLKTLNEIGLSYKTDKASTQHDFLDTYEKYLFKMRDKEINLLEIGIGNLNCGNREGESLLMWAEYFRNGRIHGVDLEDKAFLDGDRIKTFKGDQTDGAFLDRVISEIGVPDIIIDDASHLSPLTIKTLEILFPKLKNGGLYIVEDIHTSYWRGWGGHEDTNSMEAATIMNYLFKICHSLSHKEIPNYRFIQDWHETVESVHFYNSTVILLKK